MPDRPRGAVSCTAAATSSARSTATGIWLPKSAARHERAPWRSIIGWRRSIRSPPRWMTALAAYRFLLAERHPARRHHHRRRFRRRRARGRRDAGDPRRGTAAARMRLADLAMGGHGGHRRQHGQQGRHRSDRAEGRHPRHGEALSEWRRSALTAGGTDLCRSARACAAADPGRCGGDIARRCDPPRAGRRCGGCRGRPADLAGNDPRLAHLSSGTCGRTARHRRGRRIRPRNDVARHAAGF